MNVLIKKVFRKTPLHPQFLLTFVEKVRQQLVEKLAAGKLLDVGCGDRSMTKHIAPAVQYVGLDYPVTGIRYQGEPDVFGSAEALPFASEYFDTVLLLEVLEHIENPSQALSDIARVLKYNGKLILSVPFLYPVHDAPHDYSRWTIYGLNKLFSDSGFYVVERFSSGNSFTTLVVLSNLILVKQVLGLPLVGRIVTAPMIIIPIVSVNIFGLFFHKRKADAANNIFALGYTFVLAKSESHVER